MAAPNILGAYELLRRAMQQQSLQPQGTGSGSPSNGTPGYDPDGYGDPQSGLVGRLAALQAEQSRYQPLSGNDGAAPPVSRDPNFRQLSREPVANRPQVASDTPTRSADQRSPAYSSADGSTSFDSPSAAAQRAGLFGAYSNRPAWMVAPPMMTPGSVGLRVGGIRIPFPTAPPMPGSPSQIPQLPMSAIPEWWKIAGALLQLPPAVVYHLATGKGDIGGDPARAPENPALPLQPPASRRDSPDWSKSFAHPMAPRKGKDEEDGDETNPEIGTPKWL